MTLNLSTYPPTWYPPNKAPAVITRDISGPAWQKWLLRRSEWLRLAIESGFV